MRFAAHVFRLRTWQALYRLKKNFDRVVHRSRWFGILFSNDVQFELALRFLQNVKVDGQVATAEANSRI